MAHAITRRVNWQDRLTEVIVHALRAPFVWGEHDCLLFVADCVAAVCGVADPAVPAFRGRYRTERGAARKMKEFSGGGLVATLETFAARYGFVAVAPAFAQRGDVVAVETGRGACAGVVDLTGRHCAVVDFDGLRLVPLRLATKAWRL